MFGVHEYLLKKENFDLLMITVIIKMFCWICNRFELFSYKKNSDLIFEFLNDYLSDEKIVEAVKVLEKDGYYFRRRF